MCAHYTVFIQTGEGLALADIYPGREAPVLKPGPDGALTEQTMVWGFPVEVEGRAARPVFNTRVETARTKPLWRNAYAHRRCLVPAAAFEEWQHGHGGKTLCRFTPPEGPLYIAGIYEKRADGREYFSMLTTRPNAAVRGVHDRMPLVLREDEVAQWLHGAYDRLADREHVPLHRQELPGEEPRQLSMF